jgi:hypothetical protein
MAAEELSWVPDDVDLTKPNAARVYDYFLGGANNFDVDRAFARKLTEIVPDAPFLAVQNRGFLRRAVKFVAEQGVRQFLDLGSGIPTAGNTHEIAQAVDPAATVVYVDFEAVAVAHSELILADNPNATVVRADFRTPEAVLNHPAVRAAIDFSRPVGILMFSSVHFISEQDKPWDVVAAFRDATAPGSYLALSHATNDQRPEIGEAVAEYKNAANSAYVRTRDEFGRFFAGYELVEPGVVYTAQWHADVEVPDPWRAGAYAAVGIKR